MIRRLFITLALLLVTTQVWAYDPGSIAAGASVLYDAGVVVNGAELGDAAAISAPYDLQGIAITAYVWAPNAVKFTITNTTASPINLDSGLWIARVYK